MRFLPVNIDSFLIELASLDETLALYDTLWQTNLIGVDELVPAARTVMVHFLPALTTAQQLIEEIKSLSITTDFARNVPQVTVPVRYDGQDLPALAEKLNITAAQLIDQHQSLCWKVAFTGFAPGFAYMVSSGWPHKIARRETPRTSIPAGSLALAGEFCGIYPQASPGGWQLIGTALTPMWNIGRQPPALLQPGAEVRFEQSEQKTIISLPTKEKIAPKNPPPSLKQAAFTILSPGLLTSWQDAGRRGQASMGISESGAMDKKAWREANYLVGNTLDAPVLEITCGGFSIKAQTDIVLAVTGAECALTLKVPQGQRYPIKLNTPFALQAGDTLNLGATQRGLRNYLALRGGFAVEPVLSSASFDTLAQVGPAPLQAGDTLYASDEKSIHSVSTTTLEPKEQLPAVGETVVLDIVQGPRADWFDADAYHLLANQLWEVTAQSNRIGLRLHGEKCLKRSQTQELPSEGTCLGAIQVPASGQPVLFLNDHPLTGGYPVIAAVAPYHLNLAGQISPGCKIKFNLVEPFSTHLATQE